MNDDQLVHLSCGCGWERYAPVGSESHALTDDAGRHVDHVITTPVAAVRLPPAASSG